MNILLFIIGVLLVAAPGWLLARRVLGKKSLPLALTLALPLGSLLNVLLTAIYTLIGIPLNIFTLWIGLGVICAVFFALSFLHHPQFVSSQNSDPDPFPYRFLLRIICALLLASHLIYGITHAVLLPSFQIDSLTNWTMRSQVSFADQVIAFDRTEERGVAKPQYPFLFHALQITANQGQPRWNDTAANAVTLLLTLSSFAAIFLLLKRLAGTDLALLTVTLILGIPLVSLHLAQGYADIHLLGFGLLSFLSLALGLKEKSSRWFLLSALMAAAAAWTKTEGLTLVLLPWMLAMAWLWWLGKEQWKSRLKIVATGVGLAALFYVLLLIKGLPLTPHESDAGLLWRPDAWLLATTTLFTNGSFGLVWYALAFFVALILWMTWKKDSRVDHMMLPLFLWGLFAFAQTMFVYTFTPNVEFLLNAQSFYRQMFIPAAMLLCACVLTTRSFFKPPTESA